MGEIKVTFSVPSLLLEVIPPKHRKSFAFFAVNKRDTASISLLLQKENVLFSKSNTKLDSYKLSLVAKESCHFAIHICVYLEKWTA